MPARVITGHIELLLRGYSTFYHICLLKHVIYVGKLEVDILYSKIALNTMKIIAYEAYNQLSRVNTRVAGRSRHQRHIAGAQRLG